MTFALGEIMDHGKYKDLNAPSFNTACPGVFDYTGTRVGLWKLGLGRKLGYKELLKAIFGQTYKKKKFL